MQNNLKRVAIIGSSKLGYYEKEYEILSKVSGIFLNHGIEVSTGGAFGADNAAMEGVKYLKDSLLSKNLHVYLPWPSYNRDLVPVGATVTVYSKFKHHVWFESVEKYHRKPEALSHGAVALMARNYGIIADPVPVDMVICLPRTISNQGGTGQGMRIAEDLKIPMYNLRYPGELENLKKVLRGLGGN